MKWTDYRELSIEDRRNRLATRFKADCHDALETWKRDFPDRKISPKRLTHFLSVAHGFHRVHSLIWDGVPVGSDGKPKRLKGGTLGPRAWARQRYVPFTDADFVFIPSELPGTMGECFVSELASLGPLCWGWRSPAKSGEKSKGTLRRGMLQIISDHMAGFGGRDQLILFLDSTDLKGKSTMDVAREYAQWSRAKESLESIAGAISDRIGKLDPL